ncbi:MAG: Wzy polymerase domain-containing protein [Burkholderiaceae bacterium]|nr:Wzy polymerase domain-containing protein [Burkholderiaceae bacterium]
MSGPSRGLGGGAGVGSGDSTGLTFGALAVALPFLIALSLSPSSTYFNQAAAVVGGGFWLLGWAVSMGPGRPVGLTPAARWMLLGLGLLAAAMAVPGAPLGQRLLPLGCVLLAAALLQAAARAARAGRLDLFVAPLMLGLLVAGLASLAIGVVQVFLPDAADGLWVAMPTIAGRAIGNMRQPNQLSTLLMWSIAAAVWLGLQRGWSPARLAAVLAVLVFGVAMTASRTGTLGLVLLSLWGLVDRRLPGWLRGLLLAGLPLYALSWWGLEQWLTSQGVAYYGEDQLRKTLHGDASSSRGRIWANTWAMIQAQPWWGTGVGAFNFVWSMTPFPDRPVAFFDHSHSLPLQLAAEYGLPIAGAVLAALGLGLGSARRGLTAARDERAHSARVLGFMLLLIGVHSLLEYPLWYTYFLLPTAVMAGSFAGLADEAQAGQLASGGGAAASGRGWGAGLLAGALAGLLAVAGTAWSTWQYWQVAVIFEPQLSFGEPLPLEERIARGQRSLLWGHHADYARVTMATEPAQVFPHFERPLYHLLDTRLMTAYARALAGRGELERARHVAARLQEFRNPASQDFFSACEPAGAASAGEVAGETASSPPRPFQCGPDPRLDALQLRPGAASRP